MSSTRHQFKFFQVLGTALTLAMAPVAAPTVMRVRVGVSLP